MAGPYGPPVLTPADFATLQNTLGPMGVLTQMEAERATQAKQLAQRSREAQTAAGQAGQAYQEAAAAPPPNVAPNEELINSLTGGLSQILGNRGAADRAQQRTRDTRSALLQARADNLLALRDNWKQRADFADKAGDLEAATTARQKFEQLSKTFDQLQQTQGLDARAREQEANRAHDINLEKLRGRNALAVAKERESGKTVVSGPADIIPYVEVYTKKDGTQVPLIKSADIPQMKERGDVVRMGRSMGIKVTDKTQGEALNLLKSVRADMDDISSNTIPLLPEQGGFARVVGGGKNRALAAMQLGETGAALAGYPATRTAAIKTIQALASLGHGLRINQAEIKAAQNFDYPRIDDTQATANEKFRILEMMLSHIESAVLGEQVPQSEVEEVVAKAAAFRRGGKQAEKPEAAVVRWGRDKNGKPVRLN